MQVVSGECRWLQVNAGEFNFYTLRSIKIKAGDGGGGQGGHGPPLFKVQNFLMKLKF